MPKLLFLFFLIYSTVYMAQDECGQAGGYTGILKEKHSNGAKKEENSYVNGVKHGICLSFYLDGTLRSKEKYQMGKLTEVLQSADAAHDAKDYKALHPARKQEYSYTSSKSVPDNRKWRSEKVRINDSTEAETCYSNNKPAIERTYIKGDKRYERFYYREENVPGSYFNRNYEARYYYGKLHGESISYFNNGNIQRKRSFELYDPVGLHYTYYNNLQHNIKSITYYPKDNRNPIHIRNYDTLGNYHSFEKRNLNYGGAYKTVTFNNNTGHHSWSANWYFHQEPVKLRGIIEDGCYRITDALTKSRQQIIIDGKYSDGYIPIIIDVNQADDTVAMPKNKGSHTEWVKGFEPIATLELHNHIMGHSHNFGFDMFTMPSEKWKGKIKNGYLTGEWKLKSGYAIYDDIKINTTYSGRFEKSRREGLWLYENDWYKYTINYINGKKEGELNLTLKNYDVKKMEPKTNFEKEQFRFYEGEENYIVPTNLPDLHNNYLSVCTGSFKNDEMHGEWKVYYRYPDLLAFKAIYNDGVLIGNTEEYNIRRQLIARRTIVDDKIINEALFTPLGDEYNKAFVAPDGNGNYTLDERKNTKYPGKYLRWNNYTGDIYEKGYYKNGLKNGEWFKIHHGDTLIYTYKNDTLNGFYKYDNSIYHSRYHILEIGSYSKNEKSGLWKTTNSLDSAYKEEVFMDQEKYLITYIHKNKKQVENGNGIKISNEEGLLTKTEEHYKNGKIFKTVLIYTQTNETASIIYNTPHGDSIAYYMPPESGTCIKNGTGMKTFFDELKRISKIEYYVSGKLVKHDIYNDGRFNATYYFHYISDTTKTTTNVLFEKNITKPYSETDYYQVALRISNIPKNASVFYLSDNYSALTSYSLEITNAEHFYIRKEGGNLILQPKSFPVPNFLEIKYQIPYHNAINNDNTHVTIYTTDKKHIEVYPKYHLNR